MKEGIIELDSDFAKEIGFTSDKFQGYLWKVEDYIYISFIKSINREQGNLSSLFSTIQEKGFGIKVPTPFPLMESICKQKGFTKTFEHHKQFNEEVDVWILEQSE